MSVTTKRGDGGQTGLAGGIRVSKANPRVETYGTTDELETVLGFARSLCPDTQIAAWTTELQRTLFRIGSALATPPESTKQPPVISQEDIDFIRSILSPASSARSSALQLSTTAQASFAVARTVCQRAIRNVEQFAATGAVFQPTILIWLQALTDLLAVLSRSDSQTHADPNAFTEAERAAVYRTIHSRRDVRRGYLPQALPEDVLERLLSAAHCAPSVGLMQPSRFILIRSLAVRQAVHHLFEEANAEAAAEYTGPQRALYASLKLEGILEAPQNLCIVSDTQSSRGHELGRRTMPETAAYSTVCAIQNLWLAARAEGVGVGWVSILQPDKLRELLHIPAHLLPVAYLCLGYVDSFADSPDLERAGWEQRLPLASVLHLDQYQEPDKP